MKRLVAAPYEMASLFPKSTGLPFVVWIAIRGGARYDVRVKVSANAKVLPGEMATVTVRPAVRVIAGELEPSQMNLVREWIGRNTKTLIDYWEGEIDTPEVTARLVKV